MGSIFDEDRSFRGRTFHGNFYTAEIFLNSEALKKRGHFSVANCH